MAGEGHDRDGHERPQRKADECLVKTGRIGRLPDAAVGQAPRHPPYRTDDPGLGQGGSTGGLGPQEVAAPNVIEVVWKFDVDLHEELHGRDDIRLARRRLLRLGAAGLDGPASGAR